MAKNTKLFPVPAVIAPKVPSKTPFIQIFDRFATGTEEAISSFSRARLSFLDRFNANATDALTWKAEELMKAQVEANLTLDLQKTVHYAMVLAGFSAKNILPIGHSAELEQNVQDFSKMQADEEEKVARSIVAKLAALRAQRLEKILHKSRYPARSTSAVSNLAEQNEIAALSDSIGKNGMSRSSIDSWIERFERVYIAS